ncbi:uncharacterized protein LOC131927426 isoform X2 [Physella acuta]|nr:uncharacterized protein LOC131927426 isoform X2 [Physella acuta]
MEGVSSLSSFFVMRYLIKIWSPRTISLIGSFFLTVGVAGNSLAIRYEYFCLTEGVCFGLAYSMLYGPAFYVVTQYFVKRRPLAVTFASCGTSLGGIIFPLLINHLLDNYAFSGGLLLTAGVLMHSFVFSSLYTPIDNYPRKNTSYTNNYSTILNNTTLKKEPDLTLCCYNRNNNKTLKQSEDVEMIKINKDPDFYENLRSNQIQAPQLQTSLTNISSNHLVTNLASKTKLESSNGFNKNTTLISNRQVDDDIEEEITNEKSITASHTHYLPPSCETSNEKGDNQNNSPKQKSPPLDSLSNVLTTPHALSENKLPDDGMFEKAVSTDKTSSIRSNEVPDTQDESSTAGKSMLIRSLSFWALILFYFCAMAGHSLPAIFLPAFTKERGFTAADGAFFASLMNVLDIPARIIGGVVVNFRLLRPTTFCIGPMLVVGVVGNLMTVCTSYESILCMAITYSLCLGSFFSMHTLIAIDVLGLKNFPPAIAVYYLTMGVGSALSYPVAGLLKDLTGTYNNSFHFIGSLNIVAVFVLALVIPYTESYDVRRGVLSPRKE